MSNIDVVELVDYVVSTDLPDFVFRPHQKDTVVRILNEFINNSKRYVILDAGTGTGKSWIAVIVGKVMNLYLDQILEPKEDGEPIKCSSLYLTKTIALQHQYNRDFPYMKVLKSASNFDCHSNETMPIPLTSKYHDTCKFHRSESREDNPYMMACSYQFAKNEYEQARLKLLNYAFFFTSGGRYSGEFLVIDEAHTTPTYLIDYNTIDIRFDLIESYINKMTNKVNIYNYFNIEELDRKDLLSNTDCLAILQLCSDACSILDEEIEDHKDALNNIGELGDSSKLLKIIEDQIVPKQTAMSSLTKLGSSIYTMLYESDSSRWVQDKDIVEVDEHKYNIFSLKSLDVMPSFLSSLDLSHNVLFMSGTCGTLVDSLNIPEDQVSIVEVPYVFPLENRPFIVFKDLPVFNYRTKDTALPAYVERIDQLLDNMQTESGIIHSVSYFNAEKIMSMSRHKNRLYMPNKEELRDIESVIIPGRVLISPAMIEGIDLKGDLARFQIFIKVPYPNLSSRWMREKLDENPTWYNYEAITSIIQGSGRAVRSGDDKAITFMLDPSFERLYYQCEKLIPQWFKDTIQ